MVATVSVSLSSVAMASSRMTNNVTTATRQTMMDATFCVRSRFAVTTSPKIPTEMVSPSSVMTVTTTMATVAVNSCMVEDPMCGDGTLDHGEQCDDGNKMDGDGCSAQCVIEFCGDGLINLPKEQCDDGNNKDGDGCSAKCQLESNSTCVEALDQGLLFGENY